MNAHRILTTMTQREREKFAAYLRALAYADDDEFHGSYRLSRRGIDGDAIALQMARTVVRRADADALLLQDEDFEELRRRERMDGRLGLMNVRAHLEVLFGRLCGWRR